MATKAERAVEALRECADAVDACPLWRPAFLGLGRLVDPKVLREEADWIEGQVQQLRFATEEPDAD